MYKITGIGNAICNDGKEEYVDIVDYDYKCNSIEEVLSVIKKCLETGFIKIEIRNEYKEV